MKKVVLLLLVSVTVVIAERYSILNFKPVNDIEAHKLMDSGCEIVHVYEDGSVDVIANEHDYNSLLATGLPFTTRIDDLEGFYSSRFDGKSMGGYLTWDELSIWLDDLHDTFPSITSAPTSIGDTYEGRPQRVVKISSNNDFWTDDPSLPNVWYDALIHAREPASMRNVRFFMLWLCDNYGRNGFCGLQSTWLLDNREIWCLPCNNVDGYVYNQTTAPGGGGMHRKNMNWSAGGDGVDLNRNWTVGWGGTGSSGSPGASTYRGTGPLSEPESNNIDVFWKDHPPVEMHSTHTYGNILIRPWGYTPDSPPDDAAYNTHAEIMVQWGTGEVHGQSWGVLYASAGNTRDHSSPSCYLSGGTGTITWTETAIIPENGGGRLSFWAYYNIPNGTCQGSIEVSTDGGENWYYLQTFTRDDRTWRFNIHELDEWQGDTLSFRWETVGSSSDLYIDDTKIEIWQENEFIDLSVPVNSYTFATHENGEFWYRTVAMDPDFGPGWPSEAIMAQVTGSGVSGSMVCPGITRLGHFSPNPASVQTSMPVTISSASEGLATLAVYDLAGRQVTDLSSQIEARGLNTVIWDCSDSRGNAVPGGIYFIVIDAPDLVQAREIVITGR